MSSTSPASTKSGIEDSLRKIVGADHVRMENTKLLVEPGNDAELSDVLCVANSQRLAVVPRGNSTKAGWTNPPERADIILSTLRLNRVLEHAWADLTVTVEAGCTVTELQKCLAQHGQRLAIDPLWPDTTTVGGLISSNDSGSYRLRFGSVRDLIIGITLALPDGTLARSGGKVVKNVAGYDLPKLVTGAMGTLGVITRAVFRLHPLPQNRVTLTVACSHMEEAQRILLGIQDSKLAHVAMQVRYGSLSESADIDILLEGTAAGIQAQLSLLNGLASPATFENGSEQVWQARQQLWAEPDAAIAKLSVLPADISASLQVLRQLCDSNSSQWAAVIQATGLGAMRISSGSPESVQKILSILRRSIEGDGGSLTLLRSMAQMPHFDAWGSVGDSLALMRAVKERFDPNRTLNPGVFVGGI